MKDLLNKRRLAAIEANLRDTTAQRAKLISTDAAEAERPHGFRAFIRKLWGRIAKFFGWRRQVKPIALRNEYRYTGPMRAKGDTGRYDIYMRRRGRKYKATTRSA